MAGVARVGVRAMTSVAASVAAHKGSGAVSGRRSASRGPGSGDGPRAGHPPVADRGGGTRGELVSGELVGGSVDWLSATLCTRSAELLLAETEHAEEGQPGRGFKRSELRTCFGGQGWRRWEPVQSSPRWGAEYESWEWASSSAQWPASRLRGLEDVRPSRVDVAFDFAVDDDVRAERVIDRKLRRSIERRRHCSVGMFTKDHQDVTRYVGTRSSDRSLKVYRKDLKDAAWLIERGHVLRVELTLRDGRARAWWDVWKCCETRGIHAAAAHVQELTGRRVLATDEPVPPRLDEPGVEAEAAQMVLEFVTQNAATLRLAADLGVDVFGLADRVAESWSKATRSRDRERRRKFAGTSAAAIEEWVTGLLASRTQRSFT